jgi:tetratricopeptide (TPR) repeat protein
MLVDLNEAVEEHRRGNIERAASLYQAALAADPNQPDALNLLGVVKLQRGEPSEAARLIGRAAALRPLDAAIHANLGEAYRALGDNDQTIHCCRTALRLDPNSADVHGNLALALVHNGQLEAAIDHYRELIRLKPGTAFAHHNLGNIFQTLGRLDEARDCFLEAIRLQPKRAATHAGIAHVWEQLGDFEQAIASLRATLEHEPGHAWALGRLATRLRGNLSESDQTAIETLLANPGLSRVPRSQLLFGLIQALDDRGDHDRAARLSLEANALQLEEFRDRGLVYDHPSHHRLIDRLIAEFTPAFFDRVRGFGLATERPVFIVGLPRSGTSLTEQILASHPRVFGAGELTLARRIFDTLPGARAQGGMPFDCLPSLDRDSTLRLAERYLDELALINASADRIVDKMPDNTVFLGLLATLFPQATLIHCRRDRRDVALSCWMTHFMQVRWACDFDQIALRIDEHERLMRHWRAVLPARIIEVDYEDLVADLENGARAIVAGCGLEWAPACLDFHKTRRPVRTSSVEQVRQPVYTSSVGRWRNYERTLAPLFAKLAGPR